MKQCWKTKNSFKQTCSKNPPWLHALLTVYVEIPVASKTTAINAHFKHVNSISHRVLAWKQYSLDALNYTLCIFEMKYQTNEGKKKKKEMKSFSGNRPEGAYELKREQTGTSNKLRQHLQPAPSLPDATQPQLLTHKFTNTQKGPQIALPFLGLQWLVSSPHSPF